MIEPREIVEALDPLNGEYFSVPNLSVYADKVSRCGKSIVERSSSGNLLAFVLYYDDGPAAFVTMVWTNPHYQRQGLARGLMRRLLLSTPKPIRLQVHVDNPAATLYEALGFEYEKRTESIADMVLWRNIAIMQPYTFPYIGYFHLAMAADLFVFYDDVNYIKQGWINRNRILLGGQPHLITIPVVNASQNKLINQVGVISGPWVKKIKLTLSNAYKKAPQFEPVMAVVSGVLERRHALVSDLAVDSVASVFEYLGLPFNFVRSSVASPETRGLEKSARLTAITARLGYGRYINLAGGVDLYSKEDFAKRGINLSFVKSECVVYPQFTKNFAPWLSIIDVLMFNEKHLVHEQLRQYRLE